MISPLDQQAWDQKAIDLGGSILQSWAWGQFQDSIGFKVHRFSGDNYLNQVLEQPMPLGKKYLYSAKGPIGDVDASLNDIKELGSDRDVVFARIEPAQTVNLPKAAKDTQPTLNWLLDLTKTDEELLAAMKSKHRYNINLAAKKGVMVRQAGKADILTVYKLLLETAGRNNFRLHPQNYYWEMFDHLAPKHLRLMLAEYQGQALAGMFLTSFGDTAIYLHGGTSSQNKEVMAAYLLHWEAIKLARSLGCKHYDFGGVAPEGEPNHPWAGISRFKRGFGGFELASPGAFDLIFSPVWYNVYKNARKFRKLF